MLPLIFLAVLTLAKCVAEDKPFWQRAVDIGWDMCILGVGLAAGLFSDKEFLDGAGGQMAVFATSSVLGVDLILAILILLMMKHEKFSPRFGTLAVISGVMAVAIPCGLLMWR